MKKPFLFAVKSFIVATVFSVSYISGGFTASAQELSNRRQGYGQGKVVDRLNRPVDAVAFDETFKSLGARALTDDSNAVLLTFDQGYENGYTEKILDTLKEKNVRAIFFLTGDYAKKETSLCQRMVDEGHMLGNHGMKHALQPALSREELREELMSLHELVLEKYGVEMQYMRPPCGEFSEVSISCAKELGYQTLMWSFAYVDWLPDKQPLHDKALQAMTNAAHGGAIYLLHSVSATNADVLGEVIDALRAKKLNV
jgi:peptidoglycan-N-acetylmuramic acid deacetylase